MPRQWQFPSQAIALPPLSPPASSSPRGWETQVPIVSPGHPSARVDHVFAPIVTAAAAPTTRGWEAFSPVLSTRRPAARAEQDSFSIKPAVVTVTTQGWETQAPASGDRKVSKVWYDSFSIKPVAPISGWEAQAFPFSARRPLTQAEVAPITVIIVAPPLASGWWPVLANAPVKRPSRAEQDSFSIQPAVAALTPRGWEAFSPSALARRPSARDQDSFSIKPAAAVATTRGWETNSPVSSDRKVAKVGHDSFSIKPAAIVTIYGWEAQAFPFAARRPLAKSTDQDSFFIQPAVAAATTRGWEAFAPVTPARRPLVPIEAAPVLTTTVVQPAFGWWSVQADNPTRSRVDLGMSVDALTMLAEVVLTADIIWVEPVRGLVWVEPARRLVQVEPKR